ncbi:MAG: hypothetical protein NTW29_19525 [Bacteroidetes bacterium]|nr:hypothetical protein [Bacteroidota bacterium]
MFVAIIYMLSSFYSSGFNSNCEVFLSLKEKNKIVVYNSTQKTKILGWFGHKVKDEDYLMIDILNSNDSMYFVSATYSVSGKTIKGWISRKTKLAIFSKFYDKELLLYKEPKKKEVVFKAPPSVKELEVLACKDGWLKIRTKDREKRYTGWIPPESQCSNPYTTCN